MTASDIIEALGGSAEVARSLCISHTAVANWKRRGLPRSRMLDIFDLAKRKRRRISLPMIRAATQPDERRAVTEQNDHITA